MLESLFGVSDNGFVFPNTIDYRSGTINLPKYSTSGVPPTVKRAGAAYVGSDGNVYVLGGTSGSSMLGEQILYKYNISTNSLSTVTTFMTDSRYYLSVAKAKVVNKNYVIVYGYNTLDVYDEATPTIKYNSSSPLPAGGFNHSVQCIQVNGKYKIISVTRPGTSKTVSVVITDFSTFTVDSTTSITLESATANHVSVAYNGQIVIFDGSSKLTYFNPLTKTTETKQLVGSVWANGSLKEATISAHLERDHMYIPYQGYGGMLVINLKTLGTTSVIYGDAINDESSVVLHNGKLYTFFGYIGSREYVKWWTIRDYPVVPTT